jgi:hypothetical protein
MAECRISTDDSDLCDQWATRYGTRPGIGCYGAPTFLLDRVQDHGDTRRRGGSRSSRWPGGPRALTTEPALLSGLFEIKGLALDVDETAQAVRRGPLTVSG